MLPSPKAVLQQGSVIPITADEIMMGVLENESPLKCILCSEYITDCVIVVQYLGLWGLCF